MDYVVSEGDDSMDNDHPLINKPSTDKSYPLKERTAVDKQKLKKLNDKFGPVSKNFVTGEGSKNKEVDRDNIGHLSNKQLKDKLENIEDKTKAKKKGNINGKVGINKKNNYTPDKYAPRKTCVKCGSVNHLSINCKTVVPNSYM